MIAILETLCGCRKEIDVTSFMPEIVVHLRLPMPSWELLSLDKAPETTNIKVRRFQRHERLSQQYAIYREVYDG